MELYVNRHVEPHVLHVVEILVIQHINVIHAQLDSDVAVILLVVLVTILTAPNVTITKIIVLVAKKDLDSGLELKPNP